MVTWYTSTTPWYTLETVTVESILDAKPGPGADAFVVVVCLLFPDHRVGERVRLHQLETETMICSTIPDDNRRGCRTDTKPFGPNELGDAPKGVRVAVFSTPCTKRETFCGRFSCAWRGGMRHLH